MVVSKMTYYIDMVTKFGRKCKHDIKKVMEMKCKWQNRMKEQKGINSRERNKDMGEKWGGGGYSLALLSTEDW